METAVISGGLDLVGNGLASRSDLPTTSPRQSRLKPVVVTAPKPAPKASGSVLKLSVLSSIIEQLKSDGLSVEVGNVERNAVIVLNGVEQCNHHGGFWPYGACPTCESEGEGK